MKAYRAALTGHRLPVASPLRTRRQTSCCADRLAAPQAAFTTAEFLMDYLEDQRAILESADETPMARTGSKARDHYDAATARLVQVPMANRGKWRELRPAASESPRGPSRQLSTLFDHVRYAVSLFPNRHGLVFAHGTTDPLGKPPSPRLQTLHLHLPFRDLWLRDQRASPWPRAGESST